MCNRYLPGAKTEGEKREAVKPDGQWALPSFAFGGGSRHKALQLLLRRVWWIDAATDECWWLAPLDHLSAPLPCIVPPTGAGLVGRVEVITCGEASTCHQHGSAPTTTPSSRGCQRVLLLVQVAVVTRMAHYRCTTGGQLGCAQLPCPRPCRGWHQQQTTTAGPPLVHRRSFRTLADPGSTTMWQWRWGCFVCQLNSTKS